MNIQNLHTEHDQLVVSVRAVKRGLLRLVNSWPMRFSPVRIGIAARVLAGCREERRRLDERLLHVDADLRPPVFWAPADWAPASTDGPRIRVQAGDRKAQ